MNFKKFISVVSAFAIASSMAVVASADYSENETTGVKTWDFADYTAENTAYDVFSVVDVNETGYVTINENGINFSRDLDATGSETNYATFTAEADGTISVTVKNGDSTNNRYAALVIKDAEGTTLASASTHQGSEETITADVTAGAVYSLYGYRTTSNKVSSKITSVVFTPAGYVYNEVTVTPAAVEEEYTTADNTAGLAGVYTATIENDTEFTLNTVAVSATANTGQTRGASAEVTEVAPGSSVSIVILVNGKNPGRITNISATLK